MREISRIESAILRALLGEKQRLVEAFQAALRENEEAISEHLDLCVTKYGLPENIMYQWIDGPKPGTFLISEVPPEVPPFPEPTPETSTESPEKAPESLVETSN